jgi:hypothetical protein
MVHVHWPTARDVRLQIAIAFGAGDVITVYDGIVERVGAMLCKRVAGWLADCLPATHICVPLASQPAVPRQDNTPLVLSATVVCLAADDPKQEAFFDPKLATEHTRSPSWGFTGKQFQSHWKDGGSAPGATTVIHGFGGWPLPFAPVGLGAGAMVNAVFSCRGRVGQGDPAARAARYVRASRRLVSR